MISIHLTFDDGPGPSTARLLDVLRNARFAATFFVLGKHAQTQPALLRRMVEEGHVIGNHTWLHTHDGEISDPLLEEGIAATDRLIRRAFEEAGFAVPGFIPLRLPYGTHSGDTRLQLLESLGRPHVGWTSLFHDWAQPAQDADDLVDAMCAHIADQIGRGEDAVLCLHDASPRAEEREATVDAIERWLALRSH